MQSNVLEYLEKSAVSHANSVAFVDGEKTITFAELRKKAKCFAALIAEKTRRGDPVVILMEKSIETIVSYLAVLYSGCFYIALDAEMPEKRIRGILGLVQAKIMITDPMHNDFAAALCPEGEYIVYSDTAGGRGDAERWLQCCDSDPAYVIFTSGSTGTPKGVVTSHHALIDYIDTFGEVARVDDTDVFGNQAPLDYVAAIRDIYFPLKYGARSVLIPKKYFTSPALLFDLLEEKGVNAICWVVSAVCIPVKLNAFRYKVPRLCKVIFTGAVMPCKYLAEWQRVLPEALYINHYGPTEITASCTYYVVDHPVTAEETLPIGLPFHNTDILLLDDENHEILETDGQGQICVRGSSLALGYYRNSELSGKSFVQNPCNDICRDLIFKTGDIGSWGADGYLHFHGRMDSQIKFMGHRVELTEIETAAKALEGMEECCCFYQADREMIWLFAETKSLTSSEITAHLKQLLPQFMIPRKMKIMERFPLQFNGKIDTRALREMMR